VEPLKSVFYRRGQFTLEADGGRTLPGTCARVALRLLAFAAGIVHNQQIRNPGRPCRFEGSTDWESTI
jgi:hypothetical protein